MYLVTSNKKTKSQRDNDIFDKIIKNIINMVVNSGLDIMDQRGILYLCIEKMTEDYAKHGIDFVSECRLLNHSYFMQANKIKNDPSK